MATNDTQIGSLYYDIGAPGDKLEKDLDAADKKVSDFGKKLHDGLNKTAAVLGVMGAGLTLMAKNATDFTVDLVRDSKALATQIGTTTQEASRLVAAFGRMGISAESASQMFGIFSKNIAKATEASKGQRLEVQKAQIDIDKTKLKISEISQEIARSGDATGVLALKLRELNNTLATQQQALTASSTAFDKLGISTVRADGTQKDFNTILFEVADKFKAMPNGIDKTALALELFGRSGKDMIKVLNLGSDGIKDLEKQADALGLTLTSENISAVNDFIQSQKDLKQSTDALKIAIGTTTAPVLAEFNKGINDIVLSLIKTDGPLKTVTVNVLAFGGPVLTAAAAIAAFAANLVTAWPVIVAIATALSGVGVALVGAIAAALPFILIAAAIAAVAATIYYKWSDVVWLFQYIWGWVVHNWPYLLLAISGPIGQALILVQRYLMGIVQAINEAGSRAWHWLYEAGRNVVDGFIQGIRDRIAGAVNAVRDMGSAVVRAARVSLQWHSPSKIFIEAGQSISEGMAIGIKRYAGMANTAMNSLSGSIISPRLAMAPSGGATPGGGTSTTYGDTVVNIGQVNNAQDEAFVLRRMDRNQELESRGGSPVL